MYSPHAASLQVTVAVGTVGGARDAGDGRVRSWSWGRGLVCGDESLIRMQEAVATTSTLLGDGMDDLGRALSQRLGQTLLCEPSLALARVTAAMGDAAHKLGWIVYVSCNVPSNEAGISAFVESRLMERLKVPSTTPSDELCWYPFALCEVHGRIAWTKCMGCAIARCGVDLYSQFLRVKPSSASRNKLPRCQCLHNGAYGHLPVLNCSSASAPNGWRTDRPPSISQSAAGRNFELMLLMSPCMTCASQRPAAHSDSRVGCGPPRAAWRRMTSRTVPMQNQERRMRGVSPSASTSSLAVATAA
jgi:hypothetical protein